MDECTLESIMGGVNAEVLKKMARTLEIRKPPKCRRRCSWR
jgi:hypothetical protein